jgi:hypothetical protein
VHEVGDQTKKKNYGKITKISAAFLTLPIEER